MQNWFHPVRQQGSSNSANFPVNWCTRKPEGRAMQDELPTRLLWSFPLSHEPTESTKAAPPARLKLPRQNSSIAFRSAEGCIPHFPQAGLSPTHRYVWVLGRRKGVVLVIPFHVSYTKACELLPTSNQFGITLQFSGFLAFTKDCARLHPP